MAKNLKDYRRGANDERPNGNASGSQTRSDIAGMVNEYGGKSEDELMRELFRITGEKKREGSFDADAMRKTAEGIMPMLTPEQQKKLNGILNRLG